MTAAVAQQFVPPATWQFIPLRFAAGGAIPAWLVEAATRIVLTARPGQKPARRRASAAVAGDAPPGFRFAARAMLFDYFTQSE